MLVTMEYRSSLSAYKWSSCWTNLRVRAGSIDCILLIFRTNLQCSSSTHFLVLSSGACMDGTQELCSKSVRWTGLSGWEHSFILFSGGSLVSSSICLLNEALNEFLCCINVGPLATKVDFVSEGSPLSEKISSWNKVNLFRAVLLVGVGFLAYQYSLCWFLLYYHLQESCNLSGVQSHHH